MDCWPVKLVGTFFLALIVYDFIEAQWEQVPRHTVIGILLTGLFLGLCGLVGEGISGAVLVVPLIMLAIFLFATYMFKRALARKGCCIKCNGEDIESTGVASQGGAASQTGTNSQGGAALQTDKKNSLTLTQNDSCDKLTLTPVV